MIALHTRLRADDKPSVPMICGENAAGEIPRGTELWFDNYHVRIVREITRREAAENCLKMYDVSVRTFADVELSWYEVEVMDLWQEMD
jgi:hypothetical protein